MRKYFLALLALLALTHAKALTFEVGYQLDALGGAPFVYVTHDVYLTEFAPWDMQFYFSPSLEFVANREWWVQAQFLADAPLATLSARLRYASDGALMARLGLLFDL